MSHQQRDMAVAISMNFRSTFCQGSFGSAYSFFLTVVILVNIASFVLSTEHGMDDYRGVCGS